ncbi:MAG TPA: protealysin inhibitor emfourin [Burkholderiaceae bacterium]|nr:protealysin inhibitor emfourin [Burkholderiaceae bacterium]
MKILATAQGGFSGKGEHYEIDTSTSARGKALEAALSNDDFFAAPPAATPNVGADLLHWTITVDDRGRRHSVSFCEDGRPANQRWQQLLNQIRAAA